MGVANLPAKRSPDSPVRLTKGQRLAVELFAEGKTLYAVSAELAKRNSHSRRTWARRIRNWLTLDEAFQSEIARLAQAELIGGTARVTKAVVNRAARGNPNMARLALEASGFHNPKVDHRHSGEVKITMSGIPRPTAGHDETPPVVDAEVVE